MTKIQKQALLDLLNCTELNMDDMEPETVILRDEVERLFFFKGRDQQYWKPIKTAPKNGIPIVLYSNLDTTPDQLRDMTIGVYSERRAMWLEYDRGEGETLVSFVPTHWRPIPFFKEKK